MSKGMKRALIIAAVSVALIALITTAAFAWWDNKESQVSFETNNVSSNFELKITNVPIANASDIKLVPKGAFSDTTTYATSIALAKFKTSMSTKDAAVTEAKLAEKVNLTFTIKEVSLKNEKDANWTKETNWSTYFKISVSTNANGSSPITPSTGVLTNGTEYNVVLAFADNISVDNAKKVDGKKIKIVIEVTATDKV